MEIVLIQHCQSEHHINGLTGGWTDTPLTDLGYDQAHRVAERVRSIVSGREFALHSSDLRRASQTASVIGQATGLELVEVRALREMNNGIAAGQTREWADERRILSAKSGLDLDHTEFPGGETWREFYARTCQCMDEITRTAKDLVVVTHGGTLGFIVSWWIGLDTTMLEHAAFLASPGSITLLGQSKFNQNAVRLFNDVSHLQLP